MPIRKRETKPAILPPDGVHRTGEYSNAFSAPTPYKRIPSEPSKQPANFGGIPSISNRDLGYFFNLAASLYTEDATSQIAGSPPVTLSAPPPFSAPPGYTAEPQSYAHEFQSMEADAKAVMVLRLFRQTRIDVFPVAERFHLGPADRQPLYALDAKPSVRSGTEFNELAITRRDPINGAWYPVCTSDIEPSLDLVKPGNWTVATLVLDLMPMWKKIVAGVAASEVTATGKGNRLRLSWGDRQTLGALGNAYGLWWDNGVDGGFPEAFYIIEGWRGFDAQSQGIIRVSMRMPIATIQSNVISGQTRDAGCAWQISRSSQYSL